MNRLSQMHIAQKFILLVSGIAVLVTAIGLYFVYQQEQSKMLYMLEGRGKIIESQTQVTRAYIAKNYVSKIKGMKGAEGVQISKDHLENPQAIPLPATATREMSEELSKTGLFNARLISSQPLNPANCFQGSFRRGSAQSDHEWSGNLLEDGRVGRHTDISPRVRR